MMPTVFAGKCSPDGVRSSLEGTSTLLGSTTGPNFVQVFPLSEERSIHTVHEPCSTEEPLTIVPSLKMSGLSLMGPRIPSGRRSSGLHVRPSSSLDLRAPAHVSGLGPYL